MKTEKLDIEPITDAEDIEPITDAELNKLKNFIGYGVTKPDVWFIGMEEAGGGEKNIRTRCHFDKFEDLREAHRKLGILKHHEGSRLQQPQWWRMSRIMLKLKGCENKKEDIRNYQSNELGQKHSNTLLSDLMHIPKPKLKEWDYEILIPQYENSDTYYQSCKAQRIDYLKSFIRENGQPAITICYGGTFREDFKRLFNNFTFFDEGVLSIAKDEQHIVIIGNLLTHKTMNEAVSQIYTLVKKQKIEYSSPNSLNE